MNALGGLARFEIGAVLSLLVVVGAVPAAERLPNVVVILADDFGYGSSGCYGADGRLVRTPNIDRLAREGMRFTDANTTSSVCSPTRYSVLTGRYCWRTTLTHEVLGTFSPLHIETNRFNMASLLKGRGYATAAVGKWHLGYGREDDSPRWRTDYTAELSPGPLDIGFDYHFGVPSNHGDLTGVYVENRYVYGLRSGKIPESMKVGPVPDPDNFQDTYGPEDTENGRATILDLDAPRRKNTRVMATLTDRAVRWLERQPKDTPFFLYFTPVAVHNPVTPDRDLAGKSAAGLYGDWIHELDRGVGGILAALDRMGATDRTLVLFTSDNGGVFKPEREDTPQTLAYKAGLKVNGPLRGGKHNVWEGGFKVPFIVRWPGKVKPGTTCGQMISLADILATTAAIVGEPLPACEAGAEDSFSFLPAILGNADGPMRDQMIEHSADGVFAIRKGPWKWIEGEPVDDIKPGARKSRAAEYKPQLYNTHDDPAETTDVSAQHPEVVNELRGLLTRYRYGGYSRQLPPVGAKATRKVAVLTPLVGDTVLNEPLRQIPPPPWSVSARDLWTARDGGVWGVQKETEKAGAALTVPVAVADGAIDYELNLNGANRHSLRVGWQDGARGGSFRVVISRTVVELTKNPSKGEGSNAVEPIARRRITLERDCWYPVRVAFRGEEATVQVNDAVMTGAHEVLGRPKTQLNFLVFGDSAGFRNVRVVRSAGTAAPGE